MLDSPMLSHVDGGACPEFNRSKLYGHLSAPASREYGVTQSVIYFHSTRGAVEATLSRSENHEALAENVMI